MERGPEFPGQYRLSRSGLWNSVRRGWAALVDENTQPVGYRLADEPYADAVRTLFSNEYRAEFLEGGLKFG